MYINWRFCALYVSLFWKLGFPYLRLQKSLEALHTAYKGEKLLEFGVPGKFGAFGESFMTGIQVQGIVFGRCNREKWGKLEIFTMVFFQIGIIPMHGMSGSS